MKPLYTLLMAAGASLLAPALSGGRSTADPPGDIRVVEPGKRHVVYVEGDSFPVLELPFVDVIADTVPLIEIIRKAQDGERRKYEDLSTLAFNQTLKVTMSYTGKKPKTQCMETTSRAFFKTPGSWRVVTLRDTSYQVGPDGERSEWREEDENLRFEFSNNDGEDNDLTQLPYYLERLDKFRFRVAHRSVRANQIVYEVDFDPLSDFDVLPGGKLWLLTPEYQIVREEFRLKNLPVPWILKGVDLLTRDWENVNGRWMVKRVTGRVDLGMNFLKIPNSVEFVALFDHYELNPSLDEKLFRGARR